MPSGKSGRLLGGGGAAGSGRAVRRCSCLPPHRRTLVRARRLGTTVGRPRARALLRSPLASADSRGWSWIPGSACLEPGPAGSPDVVSVFAGTGLVDLTADQIGIPYRGHAAAHRHVPPSPTGVAAWASRPRGRLARLVAEGEGEFWTPPRRFHGRRLCVNVGAQPGGAVRAEVQDSNWSTRTGFSLGAAHANRWRPYLGTGHLGWHRQHRRSSRARGGPAVLAAAGSPVRVRNQRLVVSRVNTHRSPTNAARAICRRASPRLCSFPEESPGNVAGSPNRCDVGGRHLPPLRQLPDVRLFRSISDS